MTDCPEHSGRDGESARASLDSEMAVLPFNQAGEGRHKCAYCAFEAGRRQGLREARQEIAKMLYDFVGNLVSK